MANNYDLIGAIEELDEETTAVAELETQLELRKTAVVQKAAAA